MSQRRGVPSTNPKEVERRLWYDENEKKVFTGSIMEKDSNNIMSESKHYDELSDDEELNDFLQSMRIHIPLHCTPAASRPVTSFRTQGDSFDGTSRPMTAAEGKSSSDTRPGTSDTIVSSEIVVDDFVNFAAELGNDILKNRDKKLEVQEFVREFILKDFSDEIIESCFKELNTPHNPRAIVVFFGGLADGGGLMFQPFKTLFDAAGIRAIGCVLPGYSTRTSEAPLTSVRDIVDMLVPAMLKHPIFLHRNETIPLSLFGHDLGGVIAFELQRELKKMESKIRLQIHCLIASACRPPHIITEFNKDKKSRKYHLENKTALLKRMIEIDMVPQILLERKDLLQIYIPLFRNCYYALEKYVYKKELGNLKLPVRCHLLTLGGSEDPTVSERHIVEWHNIVDTSEYNVEHHMFQNCGHFYWKNSPSNMQKLTQLLVNASVVSGDAGWDGRGEDNSVESISVKEEQDNDTI